MMNQMMNPDLNASREAMLREVDQAGFAVVDANLYLDTHPCDAAAIDYYNQMADAYRNAAAAFEAQFGPLVGRTAKWALPCVIFPSATPCHIRSAREP